MKTPKPIPNQSTRNLPTGWREVLLGDVCADISYGYTTSAKGKEIGPKFLRITDIVPDRIAWEDVPYCEISKKNNVKYKLEIGDIVIARTGATTGYNKIIKIDIDAVFASYLIRYKINPSIAYPFYIGHVLRSYFWKSFVKSTVGGSAQPGANAKQFASFKFLLPPLPEQKAIAEVLSSLDDKIDLLHRQNKTLENIAQTLFRKWFIEEADAGWEEAKLGNIIDIFSGKNLKKQEYNPTGKYPILGANGEIGRTDNYLLDEKIIFTGRVGTLGNVFISDTKVWLSDNTLIIKPMGNLFYYVYYSLKNTNLNNLNVGSTQPLIRQSDLKNIELLLPEKNILCSFEQKMNILFMKTKHNKSQIATLENLRDTLLPKLMSGIIKVKI